MRKQKTIVVPVGRRGTAFYEGFPFSDADVQRLAEASYASLRGADFPAAARAINVALGNFVFAYQPLGTPSEFKDWFREIANRSQYLLSAFGDLSDNSALSDAQRSFFHYIRAASITGLDYDEFPRIISGLQKLNSTAREAMNIAVGSQRPGRQPVRPRLALKTGFQAAWLAITGKETGGITKKGGDPYGPFICFCADALNEAASSLEASRYEPNRAVVAELRHISATPTAIAEFQTKRGNARIASDTGPKTAPL
jgi:hypothetical protein